YPRYHLELAQVNADGTDTRDVPSIGRNPQTPTFSADGTRMMYTSHSSSGLRQLVIADPDGSNARVVIAGASRLNVYEPVFTHDGQHVVFVTSPAGTPVELTPEEEQNWEANNILNRNGYKAAYIMNADGAHLTRLTPPYTAEG